MKKIKITGRIIIFYALCTGRRWCAFAYIIGFLPRNNYCLCYYYIIVCTSFVYVSGSQHRGDMSPWNDVNLVQGWNEIFGETQQYKRIRPMVWVRHPFTSVVQKDDCMSVRLDRKIWNLSITKCSNLVKKSIARQFQGESWQWRSGYRREPRPWLEGLVVRI